MTPHGIAIEVHVTRSLHCTQGQAMCLFLRAAVTVPYTRWQETADIYSPTTLEARCPNNQGVDMAVPSLKTLGEDPSSPLPTSGGSGRPWWPYRSSLGLHHRRASPRLSHVSLKGPLQGDLGLTWEIQDDLILQSLTTKTLFPDKVTFSFQGVDISLGVTVQPITDMASLHADAV